MSEETETAERRTPRPMQGSVISISMEKTAVVRVETRKKHPKYHKTIRRHKNYLAHDEENTATVGDLVEILPTRPLSKRKRWRISKTLQKAI